MNYDNNVSLSLFQENFKSGKFLHNFKHLHGAMAKMIKFEKTDHILVTYGNDFAFANATLNYLYLDKIIEKWNNHFPFA